MKQVLGLVAIIFCSSTLVNAQTIADLARRERAKRQTSAKVLVITNESLKESISAPNTEEKPAVESKPEAPATAPAGDGSDEKWWRGQFEKIRQDIQRMEVQTPVLESDLNTANREFLTRSYDPDGRGKRAIDEAKARLDTAKSDRARAEARLAQLEEELRRSGSPAGWAR